MFDSKEIEVLASEIAELRDHLKISEERRNEQYTDIMLAIKELADVIRAEEDNLGEFDDDTELDEWYDQVREFVVKEQKASTSLIQRRFKLGYGRAARLMDQLEGKGVIVRADVPNSSAKILVTE
jgi:DNA segregation ATPase FtsK/SpoIIIE-like protein